MRKRIFETDQNRSFDLKIIQFKRNRALTRSEAALNGSEPFEYREGMFQRNVFSKNDERPFPVASRNSTVGIDQKAAVVKVDVFIRLRVGSRFQVISADDHPYVVLAGQASDSFVGFFVVMQFFGNRGFGPKQQIDLVRECLFGKMKQILETSIVVTFVPDQCLRDTGLNKRDFKSPRLYRGVHYPARAEREKNCDRQNRQKDFCQPDRATAARPQ